MGLLNLIDETINHFDEGAKSVRAYTADNTLVITKIPDAGGFWVASENDGFAKIQIESLDSVFTEDVFGIQATY